MSEPLARAHQSDRARDLRRIKYGVTVGTALEWFDFYLYASMAALVFRHVFFPSGNPALATLASFATFTVGFVVRPLGGVVLGYLGDRVGRRTVLYLTFVLMGVSTGLIGLLPSYAAIGVAAPVLLVILRVLQGIGAGAEGSTAAVLAYEHADGASRGRQAAWPALGSSIGLLAASLTVTAVTSLDDADLYSWGWRIPFVLSFALVGLGLLVRRGLPESPEFASGAPSDEGTARTLVRAHWRGLAAVMVMTVGYLGASYTFKTFSISYLKEFRDVPANVGTFGIALASAVALIVIPVSGWLTDRVGARRLMLIGAAGIALIAFPFFALLDTGRPASIWFALIVASGVLIPLILASSSSFMAAQFPASVRSTGAGAGREVAAAAAGGVVPLIALSLVTASESHSTVGVSVLFIASAACIAVACALDQTDRVARTERSVVDRTAGQPRGDDRAGDVVPQREHR